MQDFPEFQRRGRERREFVQSQQLLIIRPKLLEEVHAIDDTPELLGEGLKNCCMLLGKRIRLPAADSERSDNFSFECDRAHGQILRPKFNRNGAIADGGQRAAFDQQGRIVVHGEGITGLEDTRTADSPASSHDTYRSLSIV